MHNWVIQGDRGTIYINENKVEVHKVSLSDKINPEKYRAVNQIDKTEEILERKNFIGMVIRYGDPLITYPHIAKALRGEEKYIGSLDSTLHLTKVMDAIRKSNETGEVVRL